jgi:hypothetical protein
MKWLKQMTVDPIKWVLENVLVTHSGKLSLMALTGSALLFSTAITLTLTGVGAPAGVMIAVFATGGVLLVVSSTLGGGWVVKTVEGFDIEEVKAQIEESEALLQNNQVIKEVNVVEFEQLKEQQKVLLSQLNTLGGTLETVKESIDVLTHQSILAQQSMARKSHGVTIEQSVSTETNVTNIEANVSSSSHGFMHKKRGARRVVTVNASDNPDCVLLNTPSSSA